MLPDAAGCKAAAGERSLKDMKVTKDTLIGDILDFDQGTAKFFLEMGMHCLGCPSSRGESIEQACFVHGTDVDQLVNNLNAYLTLKG